jgi:hypothetical protein
MSFTDLSIWIFFFTGIRIVLMCYLVRSLLILETACSYSFITMPADFSFRVWDLCSGARECMTSWLLYPLSLKVLFSSILPFLGYHQSILSWHTEWECLVQNSTVMDGIQTSSEGRGKRWLFQVWGAILWLHHLFGHRMRHCKENMLQWGYRSWWPVTSKNKQYQIHQSGNKTKPSKRMTPPTSSPSYNWLELDFNHGAMEQVFSK